MSAQGLWLSAKQVNPCSSGTEKKATPLCCLVHPQHVPACIWHPALPLGSARTELPGAALEHSSVVTASCCTTASCIVPSTSAQKGTCEGHELIGCHFWGLWKWGQLLPSFQTKGQEISCKISRYKMENYVVLYPRH